MSGIPVVERSILWNFERTIIELVMNPEPKGPMSKQFLRGKLPRKLPGLIISCSITGIVPRLFVRSSAVSRRSIHGAGGEEDGGNTPSHKAYVSHGT